MAQQYLMSKRIRSKARGGKVVDDLRTLFGGKLPEQYVRAISEHRRTNKNLFSYLFLENGNLCVGHYGSVADILGTDHMYAYERHIGLSGVPEQGRRIPFRHVYRLSAEEKAPSVKELEFALKADLETLLANAHAGKRKAPARSFSSARQSGTVWDEVASAFEGGQRDGWIAFFDGERLLEEVDVEKKLQESGLGTFCRMAERFVDALLDRRRR